MNILTEKLTKMTNYTFRETLLFSQKVCYQNVSVSVATETSCSLYCLQSLCCNNTVEVTVTQTQLGSFDLLLHINLQLLIMIF